MGKTQLSLFLARQFATEIISTDSRQIYRGMDIGTAKPRKEELHQAPHHFIDHLSPELDYNAGAFERSG